MVETMADGDTFSPFGFQKPLEFHLMCVGDSSGKLSFFDLEWGVILATFFFGKCHHDAIFASNWIIDLSLIDRVNGKSPINI